MIEKRLAQWYASSSGEDLDIAEREITLTYVLRILTDVGVLAKLAFKGGTAIRKLHFGNQGRFSMDLDFTALTSTEPKELALEIAGFFDGQIYYSCTYRVDMAELYNTDTSCGVEVTYRHDWIENGRFALQASFRADPLFPVHSHPLITEQYFKWLGVDPPKPVSLNLQEIIAEKIRAAAQRRQVHDLFDLYQFSSRPFDQDLVRPLAVLKCWETNFEFNAEVFLEGKQGGEYDWADLRRLIRRGSQLNPKEIIRAVQRGFAFLKGFTDEEAILARDPYQREQALYQKFVKRL